MDTHIRHPSLLMLARFLLAIGLMLPATQVTATCSGAPPCDPECQECNTECIDAKKICILEPLPGGPTSLDPGTAPFENFKQYINGGVWDLIMGIGVGSVIFNGAIAGLQIVFSNGDSGLIEKGRHKLIWSLIGLILLIMSGVIMHFINPIAFQNI